MRFYYCPQCHATETVSDSVNQMFHTHEDVTYELIEEAIEIAMEKK